MNYSAERFCTVGELLETNHLQLDAIATATGLIAEHADNGKVVHTIAGMPAGNVKRKRHLVGSDVSELCRSTAAGGRSRWHK